MTPRPLRVVVTGSRDFEDRARLDAALDEIQLVTGILMIAEGGHRDHLGRARSADQFAWEWARSRQVFCFTCWAPWDRRGKGAGPWRNEQMLLLARPHMVLGCPQPDGLWGSGTSHCMATARSMGIRVRELPNAG